MERIYLIIDFDGFNSKLHVILTVRWFTKSDGEYFSSPVKYVLKCEIRPVGRQIPGLTRGTQNFCSLQLPTWDACVHKTHDGLT